MSGYIYGQQYAHMAGDWERVYNTSKDKAVLAYGIAVRTQTMLDARNRRTFAVDTRPETIGISQSPSPSNSIDCLNIVDTGAFVASAGVVAGTQGRVPVISRTLGKTAFLGQSLDILA